MFIQHTDKSESSLVFVIKGVQHYEMVLSRLMASSIMNKIIMKTIKE